MMNLRVMSVAVSLASGAAFTSLRDRWDVTAVLLDPPTVSNRYDELPPILLPESAAPMPTTRAGEAVFRLVVDTHGRVESATVETLAATDSTTARDVRRGLSGLRHVSLQKDRAFARRLVRCCARSPVALERLWYDGTAEQS